MVESKEELGNLVLQSPPSKLFKDVSTVSFKEDRKKEEQIKTLMRLRNQYEESLVWLQQPGG